MNARQLLAAFEAWQREGDDLVLATVYDTEGSTYSKTGAQMLIDRGGRFRGMLSGGCLEGDLAERACRVLDEGRPQAVSYDLGSSDEELWGLGVGCDGMMRIFLQPLTAARGHEPFAAMAEIYRGERAGAAATVIASTRDDLPAGATLVHDGSSLSDGSGAGWPRPYVPDGLEHAMATGTSSLARLDSAGGELEVLYLCLLPPPRVLVLGAGLDAEPLVRLIGELGWRVTVQDHRPAYIDKGDFRDAERVLNLPPAAVAESLELDSFDAAIVMSHHLQTDRLYLQQLAGSGIGYIGLLGPVARRRRLLADLGAAGEALGKRVHGPAGLDLGGRGPAAIALSIVAEMHRHIERQG